MASTHPDQFFSSAAVASFNSKYSSFEDASCVSSGHFCPIAHLVSGLYSGVNSSTHAVLFLPPTLLGQDVDWITFDQRRDPHITPTCPRIRDAAAPVRGWKGFQSISFSPYLHKTSIVDPGVGNNFTQQAWHAPLAIAVEKLSNDGPCPQLMTASADDASGLTIIRIDNQQPTSWMLWRRFDIYTVRPSVLLIQMLYQRPRTRIGRDLRVLANRRENRFAPALRARASSNGALIARQGDRR